MQRQSKKVWWESEIGGAGENYVSIIGKRGVLSRSLSLSLALSHTHRDHRARFLHGRMMADEGTLWSSMIFSSFSFFFSYHYNCSFLCDKTCVCLCRDGMRNDPVRFTMEGNGMCAEIKAHQPKKGEGKKESCSNQNTSNIAVAIVFCFFFLF